MELSQKHCVPCEGGVPPMPIAQAQILLRQLKPEWKLNHSEHLEATFTFKSFHQALNFANEVGAIADAEGHHPDLYIAWGTCRVEIWTHKIEGLTESDFILAAKIDALRSSEFS